MKNGVLNSNHNDRLAKFVKYFNHSIYSFTKFVKAKVLIIIFLSNHYS